MFFFEKLRVILNEIIGFKSLKTLYLREKTGCEKTVFYSTKLLVLKEWKITEIQSVKVCIDV